MGRRMRPHKRGDKAGVRRGCAAGSRARGSGLGANHRAKKKAAYHRAKKGGLPSSGKRRPTEYTENTELQETEIDATGIKIHRKHGITGDRDGCHRHQNTQKTRNYTRPRLMPQASKLNAGTKRKDLKAIKSVPGNVNLCPLVHGSDSAYSVYSVGRLLFTTVIPNLQLNRVFFVFRRPPPLRSGGIRTSLTPPTTQSPKPTKSHPKRDTFLRPPS